MKPEKDAAPKLRMTVTLEAMDALMAQALRGGADEWDDGNASIDKERNLVTFDFSHDLYAWLRSIGIDPRNVEQLSTWILENV